MNETRPVLEKIIELKDIIDEARAKINPIIDNFRDEQYYKENLSYFDRYIEAVKVSVRKFVEKFNEEFKDE